MIRKLGLTIHISNPLFIDKREGFRVTAQALQLITKKLDELVDAVNRLETRISVLEESTKE